MALGSFKEHGKMKMAILDKKTNNCIIHARFWLGFRVLIILKRKKISATIDWFKPAPVH